MEHWLFGLDDAHVSSSTPASAGGTAVRGRCPGRARCWALRERAQAWLLTGRAAECADGALAGTVPDGSLETVILTGTARVMRRSTLWSDRVSAGPAAGESSAAATRGLDRRPAERPHPVYQRFPWTYAG